MRGEAGDMIPPGHRSDLPLLAKLLNLLLFGGDLDENCARAGLEKIRGRLE
jgi:hypothetical protein